MLRRKRKKLLSWFPRKGKFQTKEEVEAYFASDKIQCLLCGKWFKIIVWSHLKFKHGITHDDYKEMYGLPWLRGLSGALSYEKNVEAGKRKYAKRDKEQLLKTLRSGKPSPPRPHQPFRMDFASRLGVSMKGRRKYRRKDFEAVLERMRDQRRTLNDVCGDPDMPSGHTWSAYVKKHPEFKERYRKTLYDLPYSLQYISGDCSPRLVTGCRDMRASGMGLRKIGKALGIGPKAVKRILEDSPEGYRPLEINDPKIQREKFEAILDRMRRHQRHVTDVCRDSDMPLPKRWIHFKKKHPEFQKKAREIQFTFSYPMQLETGCVSPRFSIDCQRLKKTGMSLIEIACALGVSTTSVRQTFQDNTEGFRPLDSRYGKKWLPRDYEAILVRMLEETRLLKDVCDDPDLPSLPSLYIYEREHPEFSEKIKQTYYSLPYSLQTKSHIVSPRLEFECQRLRASGVDAEKIANALGVPLYRVKWILKKDQTDVNPLKNRTRPWKWRKEAYEAVLDRMRDQQRTIRNVCKDPDLPSYEAWKAFKKRRPEFEEKYRQVLFGFPYPLQIRFGILSPGLITKCKRMRSRGMTYEEIGGGLGVSVYSAWSVLQKIKREEEKESLLRKAAAHQNEA